MSSARVNDGGNCEVVVKTSGFKDIVVWNPHVAKTAGMADMPKDGWKSFVCVEPGSVQRPVTLDAGQTWDGLMGISLAMLPDLQSQVAEKMQTQQKL